MRVLIAEDEKKVSNHIRNALRQQGFVVDEVHRGDDALQQACAMPYDAIVLDIMMPGRDGLSVLRILRERHIVTPIILLTARGEISERVEGLMGGAEDYLAKPFAMNELVARVHALARRGSSQGLTLLKVHDLSMNLVTREVKRGTRSIDLPMREFALLEYLMQMPERVLTRAQIIEHVWTHHFDTGTNVVDVYIQRLRRKIDDPEELKLLHTIRGVGYALRGTTMRPLTLKTRLTWWSSFVVAIGLLLSGGVNALVVHRGEVMELDDQLKAEAARFFEEFEHKGKSVENLVGNASEVRTWFPASHPPHLVEISDEQNAVIYRSKKLTDDILRSVPAGFTNIRSGKSKLRVAVFARDGLTLRIAADLAPVEDLTRELLMAFLAALPVLLIFAFVGGRWIAARALDPIRQITESAMQVTAQHLERRVPLPHTNDEIEKLAIVLNRTFERLESSFHQAVRFSADASHELRTPVTVLRSGIEALLLSPSLTETEQVAVSGLLEQTQRISSIISGLLLLARADAGRLAVKMEPVDLRRIVELCLEDARIVADTAAISLQTELPPTAPVLGEATRLMQIVSNLLDNAIKYNLPNGSVRVVLSDRTGAWVLDVSNTGPGITPEHRNHLFDRFFRGEHVAQVGGQGLGLSLAHELARAHGGTLELVSADTQETVFRLTLEKAVAEESALTETRSERQPLEV